MRTPDGFVPDARTLMSGNGNGKKKAKGLADPSRLKSLEDNQAKIVNVIIETPKGSRNKYAFDQELRTYTLKKVLPAGMAFPYDFGFVPSTLADDGDPTDVLVLMDEPAFPGCLLQCRLIGVIQGQQGTGKKAQRNDRVVGIELGNHAWTDIRHIDDLGKSFVKELEQFFVNFHQLKGKQYRILNVKGPGSARTCVEQGMKAYKKS